MIYEKDNTQNKKNNNPLINMSEDFLSEQSPPAPLMPKEGVVPSETSKHITKLKQWCVDCFEANSEYPNPSEVGEAFRIITGETLSDDGIKLLVAKLGI